MQYAKPLQVMAQTGLVDGAKVLFGRVDGTLSSVRWIMVNLTHQNYLLDIYYILVSFFTCHCMIWFCSFYRMTLEINQSLFLSFSLKRSLIEKLERQIRAEQNFQSNRIRVKPNQTDLNQAKLNIQTDIKIENRRILFDSRF